MISCTVDSPTLERLIAPQTRQNFVRRYWGKSPLHVARRSPDFFADWLKLEDFEGAFADRERARIVREDDRIPEGFYIKPAEHLPNRVWRLSSALGSGCTVNFLRISDVIPALGSVCARLANELGVRSRANGYVTGPHAQGYRTHVDPHHEFILQIAGEKHWTLVDPSTGAPRAITLRAGDTLYLPIGWPHHAVTTDEGSAHVNVSAYRTTWRDILERLPTLSESGRELWQQEIPLDPSARAAAVPRLLEALRSVLSAEGLESALDARQREPANSPQAGWLDGMIAAVSVRTRVARRAPLQWSIGGNTLSIHLSPEPLALPIAIRPVVEFIAARSRFTIGELPSMLEDDAKCRFVYKLVAGGALELIKPRRRGARR